MPKMNELLKALETLNDGRMDLGDYVQRLTEAYCIEHNLPCKRHYTHEQLAGALEDVRSAHQQLYGPPTPAEACTDLE